MPALCDMTCHNCKFRFGYRVEDAQEPPDKVYCPTCGHEHDMRETNAALDRARRDLEPVSYGAGGEFREVVRAEMFIEVDCFSCGERVRVRELGQTEAFCSGCSTQLRLQEAREELTRRPDVGGMWRLNDGERSGGGAQG